MNWTAGKSGLGDSGARLARNAAALWGASLVTSGVLLIWQILLARILGPDRYGIYGTIGAILAIAGTLPDLGMGSIMIREIARAPGRADRYLGASLVLHVVLAAVTYALVQVAAWAAGYEAEIRLWLLFVGLNLAIDAVGTVGHERLVAAERMGWTATVKIAHVAAMVATGAVALALGGRLGAVYGAMFAAGLLRAIAYWIVLRRHGWRAHLPIDSSAARRLVVDGAPIGLAALLTLAFMHADKLLTTGLLGTAATGQLLAAFVIVFGVVELVSTNMLVAALPALSRAGAIEGARFPPVAEQILFLTLVLGVPVAAGLIAFAAPLVRVLFGAGYQQAAAVLPILGWFAIARLVSALFIQVLTMSNRQVAALLVRAAALTVNLVVTIALLPRVGLVGAAYGMVIGEVVTLAGALWVVAPSPDWWGRLAGRLARLTPPTAALIWGLTGFGGSRPPMWAAPIGLLLYVGLAYATGALTRQYLDLIAEVAWRMPAEALSQLRRRP